MRPRGVIVFYPRRLVAPGWGNDVAFGDNFDLIAQRSALQGVAKNFFGLITAVDVGLINRGYALVKAGGELVANMLGARVLVIGEPPHSIHKP